MLSHVEGIVPVHIYKQRRPLESKVDYALTYREQNHRPTTKSPFDRAISKAVRVSSTANIKIDGIEERTAKWFLDFRIYQKNLKDFLCDDVVRLREKDANSFFIALPKRIDVELEPRFDADIPDFENDFLIDVDVLYINNIDVVWYDGETIKFKAGDWVYKIDGETEKTKEYYFEVSKDQTILEYPNAEGDYVRTPYYANNLSYSPIIPISENKYIDEYIYFLPYLWGAAAWGDQYYGQNSDFQIQATRHTYTREVVAKQECDYPMSTYSQNGVHINPETNEPCSKCGGKGYYFDETPLGRTYVDYDKLNEEGKTVVPIQFIEPPISSTSKSQEIADYYYGMMLSELGIMQQNLTNQSGESKRYDEKEANSIYGNIVRDNFRIKQEILNVVQDYLYNMERESQDITVSIIGELGLTSLENDIEALNQMKSKGAPIPLIFEQSKKVLLKQIGDTVINRKIVDFVSEYDKLFIYGLNDLSTAKAQLGEKFVDNKSVIIHNTILNEVVKRVQLLDSGKLKLELDTYYSQYDVQPTNSLL